MESGVINSTPPFVTAPPDATGGRGSFLGSILGTLTNGINSLAQAKISQQIGKTLGGGIATVDDEGNIVYRAAPGNNGYIPIGQDLNVQTPVKSFFTSTTGLLVLGGVGVVIVALIASRK